MSYEEVKLTRRDMARAEIDAAIDVLLAGNYVAAHVLAFAAKAILRGVAKAHGIETIDDVFEDYIKSEHLPEWRKSLTGSYNVFKHANDDPDRELDSFRPETTVLAIFTAVVNYGLVYKQWSLPMMIFRSWFFSRHPNFIKPEFEETIEVWKDGFGHPQGKPLAEALDQLAKVVLLIKQHPDAVFDRLAQDVKGQIER